MKTTCSGFNLLLLAGAMMLASACQTLYTGTVSLTAIVESAARDYSKSYNAGLVSTELANKVSVAHADYRKAAGIAADALEIVKAGGNADPKTALEGARVAANHFIDVLLPLLPKPRATELRAQIAKASKP